MDTTAYQDRIIRMPELVTLVGYRPSSIYALISDNKFPRGFKLVPNGRAAGWRLSTIINWIDSHQVDSN
jgi:prophage regulatory protein